MVTVATMAGDDPMYMDEVVFHFQHVRVRTVAEDHLVSQVVFLSHPCGEILQFWARES
jgi:hypothetical protein